MKLLDIERYVRAEQENTLISNEQRADEKKDRFLINLFKIILGEIHGDILFCVVYKNEKQLIAVNSISQAAI